jgi:hypothetical protein
MEVLNPTRYSGWITPTKKRYSIYAISILAAVLLVYPFESTVVPTWRLQVVDVSGNVCQNMRVTESWGHYSLYLEGWLGSDDRITDMNGYVEFPERTTRANLLRRMVVPVIAHVLVIMHGSVGATGSVYATGIKDVAWLSYEAGKPLLDRMRVEQCISGGN